MNESYLTRKQVANKLQVVPATIKNWTDKGILRSYKLGHLVRYKESEVVSAVSNNTPTERNIPNG